MGQNLANRCSTYCGGKKSCPALATLAEKLSVSKRGSLTLVRYVVPSDAEILHHRPSSSGQRWTPFPDRQLSTYLSFVKVIVQYCWCSLNIWYLNLMPLILFSSSRVKFTHDSFVLIYEFSKQFWKNLLCTLKLFTWLTNKASSISISLARKWINDPILLPRCCNNKQQV